MGLDHKLIELGDVFVFDVHHFFQFFDVHFGHVVAARGPFALLQTDDAAHDFNQTLRQQNGTSNRNDGLERVDRRAVGGDVGMLVDGPGLGGKVVAGPGQGHHARNKKQDVQGQVQPGLQPWREKAVKHVAAHMAVLGQGVGTRRHEQRAVHHAHDVKSPGVRVVQRITRKHLPGDHQRERTDQPGKRLTDHGAELVNRKQ